MEWYFAENLQEKRIGNPKTFASILPLLVQKCSIFKVFFINQQTLIKGRICGVRVEKIEEPLMQEIRYLDKLVDELAKGKAMEKILRKE